MEHLVSTAHGRAEVGVLRAERPRRQQLACGASTTFELGAGEAAAGRVVVVREQASGQTVGAPLALVRPPSRRP